MAAYQREARTCSVCFGTDAADAKNGTKGTWTTAPCSHHSHAACLKAWEVFQKSQGHSADCPMCRLKLH